MFLCMKVYVTAIAVTVFVTNRPHTSTDHTRDLGNRFREYDTKVVFVGVILFVVFKIVPLCAYNSILFWTVTRYFRMTILL